MKTYLITGIDPGLYKNFKAACAYGSIGIRDSFIKHMQVTVTSWYSVLSNGQWKKPQSEKRGKKP